MNNHGQFVRIGRVIRDAIGDGGRQQVTVTVLVLQPFTGQGSPAGSAAYQETAGTQVAGRPGQVAGGAGIRTWSRRYKTVSSAPCGVYRPWQPLSMRKMPRLR